MNQYCMEERMMGFILNVDADEILYIAAFSAEKTAYKLIDDDGDTIEDFKLEFIKKDLEEKYGKDKKFISYKIATGPVSHAIQACKHMVNKLKSKGVVKFFLTAEDKSNFRYSIAKTAGPNGTGYKAGRAAKPIYYNEVREYLLKVHKAEEVHGYEADDALGICQTNKTVAVHQDKDINRIQGKHYNYRTD